jgi:transposase
MWLLARIMQRSEDIGGALEAIAPLEALREQATVTDLAQRYEVHPQTVLRLEETASGSGRAPSTRGRGGSGDGARAGDRAAARQERAVHGRTGFLARRSGR